MSVLVDFVKFLLSFRNQDTTSFKIQKKIFLLHRHFETEILTILALKQPACCFGCNFIFLNYGKVRLT